MARQFSTVPVPGSTSAVGAVVFRSGSRLLRLFSVVGTRGLCVWTPSSGLGVIEQNALCRFVYTANPLF